MDTRSEKLQAWRSRSKMPMFHNDPPGIHAPLCAGSTEIQLFSHNNLSEKNAYTMDLEIARMTNAVSHLNEVLYKTLRKNRKPVSLRRFQPRRRITVLHGICRDRSMGKKLCNARKRKCKI